MFLCEATIIADDTNIWISNLTTLRKRNKDGELTSCTKMGMKKMQSVLGLLQFWSFRKIGMEQTGSILQVHAPSQLLPRANWMTISERLRRWCAFSSGGCAEQLGGQELWDALEQNVQLKLNIFCADALAANHNVQAREHEEWMSRRARCCAQADFTLMFEADCLTHQACLAKKPGLLQIGNLCSSLVRFTRAMRSSKFQNQFGKGLKFIASRVERREVPVLPDFVKECIEKQRLLVHVLAHALKQDASRMESIVKFFNGNWDVSFEQSDFRFLHFCTGCCTSLEDCIDTASNHLRTLFLLSPPVPLLYRWKGWEEAQDFVGLGILMHNFLRFLVRECCNKTSASAVSTLVEQDEDHADLSYALRQEVRLAKTLAFITADNILVDIGAASLVSGPLASFMNSLAMVETARHHVFLKGAGLVLSEHSSTIEDVVRMNWKILSGTLGHETLAEFTQILQLHPESELMAPFGLTFENVFMKVFPVLTDSWRRLCWISRQAKFCVLGMGLMSHQEARALLDEMLRKPKCCTGPFVDQLIDLVEKKGVDLAAVIRLLKDALLNIPASSVRVERLHASTQRNAAAFKAGRWAGNMQQNSYVLSAWLQHTAIKVEVENETLGKDKARVGPLLRARRVASSNLVGGQASFRSSQATGSADRSKPVMLLALNF